MCVLQKERFSGETGQERENTELQAREKEKDSHVEAFCCQADAHWKLSRSRWQASSPENNLPVWFAVPSFSQHSVVCPTSRTLAIAGDWTLLSWKTDGLSPPVSGMPIIIFLKRKEISNNDDFFLDWWRQHALHTGVVLRWAVFSPANTLYCRRYAAPPFPLCPLLPLHALPFLATHHWFFGLAKENILVFL